MAGFPVDAGVINNAVASNVVNLRDAFDRALRQKAWFDEHDNAALVALGVSSDDATKLRATVTALAQLAAVARGQAAQSPASNFFWDADDLTALN